MTGNFDSPNPMQPLSVGNVVSAAVRLYRSHLKSYFSLAVTAHLWVLVPIYGWAKYNAISGLISRLAFGELVNQPESIDIANRHIEPRLWSFLRVAFQVWFSLVAVYLLLAIASIVISIPVGIILGIIGAVFIAPVAGGVIAAGVLLLGLTWFYARLVVAEVPLAVEENINGGDSVARSWELTKTSVFRIQGVVIVAFLVTIPIVGLFNYVPSLYLLRLEPGSAMYWIVYAISIVTSLIGGVLIMPFWQTIKAVIYYDLRSRREGLGLQLRDREI